MPDQVRHDGLIAFMDRNYLTELWSDLEGFAMPLPLGHAAIGLTIQELVSENNSAFDRWEKTLFVAAMANLPDMDVLLGLVFTGNGSAFHRGPTHSLIFAVLMAFLASTAWKLCSRMPRMGFWSCFLVIISHIMADLLFTSSSVSFSWPLEVHWAEGFTNWSDVMCSVFAKTPRDADIITVSVLLILLKWWMGRYAPVVRVFATAMRCCAKLHVLRLKYITNLIKTRLS
jgi:LexA-binding, inner membrane-associated putative hydrolase